MTHRYKQSSFHGNETSEVYFQATQCNIHLERTFSSLTILRNALHLKYLFSFIMAYAYSDSRPFSQVSLTIYIHSRLLLLLSDEQRGYFEKFNLLNTLR